ncbi:MAG TPA: glycoside hydrolase 100 family protein [Trebonia sp.]|nr:glycoside hydrolase 100 family protein [Trebonia sp.]
MFGDSTLRLAATAAYILRDNSAGAYTKPAPALYPHQWSWDAAINAVGLAAVDVPRARLELSSLFRGQWRTGMLPHIVFQSAAGGYVPGPAQWQCGRFSADAPAEVATSGICQPPVHALAVARIVEIAERADAAEHASTTAWAAAVYPRLLAWHRFLARDRVDPGTGLITLFHGWESGMDNSPRWDVPYSNVTPGTALPVYVRRDVAHVGAVGQRPTDRDYDRYLWLIEEAKQAGYDQGALRETSSFLVGDVLFTAIFAAASDALADLPGRLGADGRRTEGDAGELRAYAARARAAVLAHVDQGTGLAADVDLRTGKWLRTETLAGFAPLIAGHLPESVRAGLTGLLLGPRWCGHPGLRWPVPPTTSPCSAAFDPDCYWRGPVWPVTTWLLARALLRDGDEAAAARLRDASLSQLSGGAFAEYYHPLTGAALGSEHQSWTAAAALDWLLSERAGGQSSASELALR